MFAGMKAGENAIASVLFHSIASEIDGIWFRPNHRRRHTRR